MFGVAPWLISVGAWAAKAIGTVAAGWLGLELFGDEIADWFYQLWISLWTLIDYVVYSFINYVYRIFMLVAKVNVFGDGEQLVAITNRLYIIIGIAMLFILAYNLILLIINPEGKQLANMGKIVKDAVISVIIIVFLPLIFQYMTIVQNHILDQNIIGQIILGTSTAEDANSLTNQQIGNKVALDIFSAFFHPPMLSIDSCRLIAEAKDGNGQWNGETIDVDNFPSEMTEMCGTYVEAYDAAIAESNVGKLIRNSTLMQAYLDGKFEYSYIISTAAGVFALWMFVSFAIDVGVRVGKLAFYQIVAPIPVMMRILPNDKMFDKWFKGIKDAYLSLFIRLIIVFFSMYAITLVPDAIGGLWIDLSTSESFVIIQFANIIVILGILMFAKEAPKLISDLFGSGGEGIKFGIKDKYKPLGRVADMARSGIYSKLYGGKNGEGGSFFAGAWRGRRGYSQGVAATDAKSEALSDGSTFRGRTLDRLRVAAGMKTRYDASGLDEEKQMKRLKIEKRREHNKVVSDSIEAMDNTAKKIVESSTSRYVSNVGQFSAHTDANGKTYSMNGKNFYTMQEVIEQAKRDGASADTVVQLKKEMEQFEKSMMLKIKQDAIKGNEVYASDADKLVINNALADLQKQVAEGAAERVDANGNVTSGILDVNGNVITKIEDVSHLKIASDAVKASAREIDAQEKAIKTPGKEYKAQRADSKYVKESGNKSDKK